MTRSAATATAAELPDNDDVERLRDRARHELLALLDPIVLCELLATPEAFRDAAYQAAGRDPELHRTAEPSLSLEEGRRRLDAARVPSATAATIEAVGATALARQLGLASRQTVYDRAARGELIGFDIAGRHRFPLAQFDERGGVLPGIAEVLGILDAVGDAYATWGWLTRPNAALDGATPIERLRGADPERVAEITAAAEAELGGAFG